MVIHQFEILIGRVLGFVKIHNGIQCVSNPFVNARSFCYGPINNQFNHIQSSNFAPSNRNRRLSFHPAAAFSASRSASRTNSIQ